MEDVPWNFNISMSLTYYVLYNHFDHMQFYEFKQDVISTRKEIFAGGGAVIRTIIS